jgi:hypothetical protein
VEEEIGVFRTRLVPPKLNPTDGPMTHKSRSTRSTRLLFELVNNKANNVGLLRQYRTALIFHTAAEQP